MKIINEILKPLSTAPLQAYVDNRIQLFDVIDTILRETGPAEIYISTFSTSEEFLRRIYKLKSSGAITRAVMLTDLKASKKTVNLYRFISMVFDQVYLGENHSKVILIRNAKWTVSVCTSQNQTRGNRAESGMISTDGAIYATLFTSLSQIINNKAILLDGLFKRTTGED